MPRPFQPTWFDCLNNIRHETEKWAASQYGMPCGSIQSLQAYHRSFWRNVLPFELTKQLFYWIYMGRIKLAATCSFDFPHSFTDGIRNWCRQKWPPLYGCTLRPASINTLHHMQHKSTKPSHNEGRPFLAGYIICPCSALLLLLHEWCI
jgi:hypothetical protein